MSIVRAATTAAACALALWAFSEAANATTVVVTSQDQTIAPAPMTPVAPASHSGNFTLSTTGSNSGQRSPWDTTTTSGAAYSAISSGGGIGAAIYNIDNTGFAFLWGSPDAYNTVTFYSGDNGGGDVIGTFTGSAFPPTGSGYDYVTFSALGGTIGSVMLSDDGTAAFEYANISAVPLPGALPMFMTGLAGLGLIAMRKKRKVGAMA